MSKEPSCLAALPQVAWGILTACQLMSGRRAQVQQIRAEKLAFLFWGILFSGEREELPSIGFQGCS